MSSNSKVSSSNLAAIYRESALSDKIILRLLALNIYAMRQKTVILGVNQLLPQAPDGVRISSSMISNTIKELVKKGLVKKTAAGCGCVDELRPVIIIDLIESGNLEIAGKILQSLLPANTEPDSNRLTKNLYYRAIRDLGIEIFCGHDISLVDQNIRTICRQHDYEYRRNPSLDILFNRPFTPQLLNLLDKKVQAFVLCYILIEMEYLLSPAQHIIRFIFENHLKNYADPVFMAQALTNHTQFEPALELLTSVSAQHPNFFKALDLKARITMLKGDNEQAIKLYQESLKLTRKKGRQYSALTNDYDSIFFLFALLKSNQDELLSEAISYIKITNQKGKTRHAFIFYCLLPLLQERLGLKTEILHDLYKHPNNAYTETEKILHSLVVNWIDCDFLGNSIDTLVKLQEKALSSGYDWQAAESSLLLAKLGHKAKKNQQLGEKLHQKHQTHSLVDIVTPLAEWEKVLISLNAVSQSGDPKNQKKSSQQRLIWYFSYDSDDHSCQIYPRVQKMTKAGNWSKGRAAALKTLFRDSAKLDYLTEQDRIVTSSIKNLSYGYYGSHEYVFEASRALPALIGHPLVFLENNPEISIELIAGKGELTIEKTDNNKIFLSLEPCPKYQDQKIMVVAETPTRYRVIEITPEYENLGLVIGKGVSLPQKAEEMARRTAVSLSDMVTIQSDLGGDRDTREIAGDPRPHLHLLPYQDGLSISFRVKPFTESGGSFMPGVGGRVVMAEIDQEKVQARRELDKERELAQKVISECPSLQHETEFDHEWLVEEPQDALELLLELKTLKEDEIFLEWPQGEKFKVRREFSTNDFSLKIKRDRDWFKASGNLDIDDKLTLNLKQLLAGMDQTLGRFLRLDDNTYIAITKALRRRLQELADYSEPVGNELRFNPLARLAMDDLTEGIKNFSGDKAWREQGRRFKEIITPKIPSTFQAQLRDYQIQGFNWLAQLSHWQIGACLADDMGLGKTIQALAVILTRAAAGPTLVAAPLSVINNWEDECQRFAPTLKPRLFGPGDRQKMLDEAGPFDLIITSYGLLQIESEKLNQIAWQTVVLDEAQAIKNMQTKRSKAAMQLKAEFKLITTGTPIENHLGELWTLYTFLNPGLLGSYKWFQERFAIPIEKYRDQGANLSLKKLIQPFILRRLKSEVLQELPAKTEITLKVEMSPEEASLYEAQRLRSLASLEDDGNDLPGHLKILVEIMKLRRLCCNPRLILPESNLTGSKLKVFANTVEELLANRHKALVFSQFVDHLSLIREYLDQKKISYQYLDGSTPVKQRKKRINDFQNGNGDLFLISLKAGGSGLNLTAADYVIHMDPWWNPAVEDQASDRAHRIGQKRPVTVYRLIVKDTIEEQIVNLHHHKRNLADNLLAGSDISGKLDAAELLKLLKQ